MAYEYDAARLEAAEHPLDAGRIDNIVRVCRELVEHHGPDPVAAHGIRYSPDAWVDLLDALPPVAREGRVTRRDVFEVATEVSSGQRPARDLFTASYIWGQGRNGYGRSRYDNIIATNSNLDSCLGKALYAAKAGSIGAYAQLFGGYLRDGGEERAAAGGDRWSRIARYGPAFFTKLLYFAGGRALILDAVLAGRVHELGGVAHLVDGRGRACAWSPYRYAVYLHWMEQTAATISSVNPASTVTPDLLELAPFSSSPSSAYEHAAAD